MAPDETQCLVQSRMITSSPTIIAELVFGDRNAAETIVAKFNNKMADGRKLYVYVQPPTGPGNGVRNRQPQNHAQQSHKPRYQHTGKDSDVMDVDASTRTNDFRNQDRVLNQPNQSRSRAPQFEDVKYGSTNSNDQNNGSRTNSGRGRGRQYGRFASDAIMTDNRNLTRRSNNN